MKKSCHFLGANDESTGAGPKPSLLAYGGGAEVQKTTFFF